MGRRWIAFRHDTAQRVSWTADEDCVLVQVAGSTSSVLTTDPELTDTTMGQADSAEIVPVIGGNQVGIPTFNFPLRKGETVFSYDPFPAASYAVLLGIESAEPAEKPA
jgi:hypothetical protein